MLTRINVEAELYQALQMKAAETNRSISALINEVVYEQLIEDAEDLQAFHDRANEPTITYEALLQDLQAHGKLF